MEWRAVRVEASAGTIRTRKEKRQRRGFLSPSVSEVAGEGCSWVGMGPGVGRGVRGGERWRWAGAVGRVAWCASGGGVAGADGVSGYGQEQRRRRKGACSTA